MSTYRAKILLTPICFVVILGLKGGYDMRVFVLVFSLLLVVGCSSTARNVRTIDDIDVSKKDGSCIRQQCLKPYSSCVEQASKETDHERIREDRCATDVKRHRHVLDGG